jgi:prepilin signal peptidase PulO-like enzyme (type II secretory pathway)
MIISDLEHYSIPDILQYLLTIFSSIFIIHQQGHLAVILNYQAAFIYLGFSLLIMLFYYLTTKIEALGIDDLKFFFIAGFVLGMENFLFFMILSGLLGILFGVIWQKIKSDNYFPFAPAICLSLYLAMIFGSRIDIIKIFSEVIFL